MAGLNETLKLRLSANELKNWEKAAKEDGLDLSKWIRKLANEASVANHVQKVTRVLHKECLHGVDQGFFCYKCRGRVPSGH